MTKNIQDRRVGKTRKLLQDALIELITEQGYKSISVQDILDRANVGRSTFYAHFQDKDDLLQSCFDTLNDLLAQHTERLSSAGINPGESHNAGLPLSLFEFAAQHHRFFKALLGQETNGLLNKTLYDSVLAQAYEHFKALLPDQQNNTMQSELMAHYVVSAFMGVLKWWVEKDMPCTAQEMETLFRQLALPGFREMIAANQAGGI